MSAALVHAASASKPVAGSMRLLSMLSGGINCRDCGFRFFIKSPQTRKAPLEPDSRAGWLSSRPTQTTATRSEEKPANQEEGARLGDLGEHPRQLGHCKPVGIAVESSFDAARELGVSLVPQVSKSLAGSDADARLLVVQDGD